MGKQTHKTVKMAPPWAPAEMVEVDENIAFAVERLWILYINTMGCCEDSRGKRSIELTETADAVFLDRWFFMLDGNESVLLTFTLWGQGVSMEWDVGSDEALKAGLDRLITALGG